MHSVRKAMASALCSLVLATVIVWGAAAQGTKFVLVHGAWHVGDAWDGVIGELERLGYGAEAITLAGHGKSVDREGVTLSDSEEILLDHLARQETPVILAGHSAAGVLLQQASGKAADKLAAVVFHNAFLIPDGTSLFEALRPTSPRRSRPPLPRRRTTASASTKDSGGTFFWPASTRRWRPTSSPGWFRSLSATTPRR